MKKDCVRGFSILEVIISLAIFSLFALVVVEIFIFSSRSKDVVFDQLAAGAEARRAIHGFIGEIRSANYSSTGAYPIQEASSTEIIFFSNIDNDSEMERIRYFYASNTLFRGSTQPTGNPYVYVTGTESVSFLTNSVVNTSTPVFVYYDENYTGVSSTPLTQPADVTKVRIVEMDLLIDKNSKKSPVLFMISGQGNLRNFKTN